MIIELENENSTLQEKTVTEIGTVRLPETDMELEQRGNSATEEVASKLWGLSRPPLQDIARDVIDITKDPSDPFAEDPLEFSEIGTIPDGLKLANREMPILINPEFADGKTIEELEIFFDNALSKLQKEEEVNGPAYSSDFGDRGYADLDFSVEKTDCGKHYLIVEQPFFR